MKAVLYPARWRACGKRHDLLGHQMIIIHDMMPVDVQAAEDRRPAGGAERRGDKRVLEIDPVFRHGVKVRCLQKRMTEKAHRVVAMIVNQDENDVAALRVVLLGEARASSHYEQNGRQEQPGPDWTNRARHHECLQKETRGRERPRARTFWFSGRTRPSVIGANDGPHAIPPSGRRKRRAVSPFAFVFPRRSTCRSGTLPGIIESGRVG